MGHLDCVHLPATNNTAMYIHVHIPYYVRNFYKYLDIYISRNKITGSQDTLNFILSTARLSSRTAVESTLLLTLGIIQCSFRRSTNSLILLPSWVKPIPFPLNTG